MGQRLGDCLYLSSQLCVCYTLFFLSTWDLRDCHTHADIKQISLKSVPVPCDVQPGYYQLWSLFFLGVCISSVPFQFYTQLHEVWKIIAAVEKIKVILKIVYHLNL